MSIDSMRVGGGRCPPLVVGVLIIACTFMLCNWWTLSSTNLELAHQIDELNEQIKLSVDDRDSCDTRHGECKRQMKECEDKMMTTSVKLSQIDDNLSTCNQELKSFRVIDLSKNATLDTLRIDLKTQKEENKKLEEELSRVVIEMEKLKLTLDSPAKKSVPAIPIALHLDKTLSDNRTLLNGVQNAQVNAPPNAGNADIQGADQDNSNVRDDTAAEVH